jgi:hypothetical protein
MQFLLVSAPRPTDLLKSCSKVEGERMLHCEVDARKSVRKGPLDGADTSLERVVISLRHVFT